MVARDDESTAAAVVSNTTEATATTLQLLTAATLALALPSATTITIVRGNGEDFL